MIQWFLFCYKCNLENSLLLKIYVFIHSAKILFAPWVLLGPLWEALVLKVVKLIVWLFFIMNLITNQLYLLQNSSLWKRHTGEYIVPTSGNSAWSLQRHVNPSRAILCREVIVHFIFIFTFFVLFLIDLLGIFFFFFCLLSCLVWFLCLMAFQPLWVIYAKATQRKAVILFNISLSGFIIFLRVLTRKWT